MLQIANKTPFKCSLGAFPNLDGIDCIVCVVKGTFALGANGVALAKEQEPIVMVDEFWDDPAKSSIKRASEMGLPKLTTDVLLRGHAYAPGGNASSVDVRLRVGELQKHVRVFGNRVWQSGLLSHKISPPELFQKIPLRYELAFGGTDAEPKNPDKADYEPRNPVGRGLVPRNSERKTAGTLLPNIEFPTLLIRSVKDRPPPAGFSPVCGHWEPRKAFAGTYDEAWTRKRAPYLPKDFDPRFFQCASLGLVAGKYLRGAEAVEIAGASPNGALQFQLPECSIALVFHFDGKALPHTSNLDTIEFSPDSDSFTMVWRACQVVDKKMHRLREVEVSCRQFRKED